MRESVGGKNRSSAVAALIVSMVGFLLFALFLFGGLVGWWPVQADVESLLMLLFMLLFLVLGPVILWKANGNRVGWAFSIIGLFLLCAAIAGGLADSGVAAAGAIGGAFWLSWIIGLGLLVLWFPTGEVPGPRWKWVEWLGFFLVSMTFITYTFTEQICVESGGGDCVQWIDNPIGISGVPNPEFGPLAGPLFSLYPLFMGAALVSLFIRLRRARGIERLQLKWFLLACGSMVAALCTEFALESFGITEPPWWLDAWIDLSVVGIPIAATLAILRYRLYEIDRIISRTVSYALVVGLLAAVFFGAVTLTTSFMEASSDMVVAGATLAVAALFNPLRRRVQAAVDRRFNRSRYDTQRVMDHFAASLRDRVNGQEVIEGWTAVVGETMQPTGVSVWVRDGV
jgi:hypothetical protein